MGLLQGGRQVSDDIVARLRRWANGAAEPEVQDVVDGLNYAADEIERLRRNIGCARNQRSTQFCAEAMDAQREIERLRKELAARCGDARPGAHTAGPSETFVPEAL
jgi:hypothetical protein